MKNTELAHAIASDFDFVREFCEALRCHSRINRHTPGDDQFVWSINFQHFTANNHAAHAELLDAFRRLPAILATRTQIVVLR